MQICLLIKTSVKPSTSDNNSSSLSLSANHLLLLNQISVVRKILSLSLYYPAIFKKATDKNNSSYKSASVSEDISSNSESNIVFKNIASVK